MVSTFPLRHYLTKVAKKEVTEFYISRKFDGSIFFPEVLGVYIMLTCDDMGRILDIPSGRRIHYVKYKWPSLSNLPINLQITWKFSGQPALTHHR